MNFGRQWLYELLSYAYWCINCNRQLLCVQLLLIDHGASMNCIDGEGNTPLHVATNAGHDKVSVFLMAILS